MSKRKNGPIELNVMGNMAECVRRMAILRHNEGGELVTPEELAAELFEEGFRAHVAEIEARNPDVAWELQCLSGLPWVLDSGEDDDDEDIT